jgi:type II secretory pathway predicted ATPase ExeA
MKMNYLYKVVRKQNAILQIKIFSNKKIQEYVVVHMKVAELEYNQCVQMKNLLHLTTRFLMEG